MSDQQCPRCRSEQVQELEPNDVAFLYCKQCNYRWNLTSSEGEDE